MNGRPQFPEAGSLFYGISLDGGAVHNLVNATLTSPPLSPPADADTPHAD
ncbi:hypothetical protein ACOKM5_06920 [Streptomyces sp. BH097]